VGVSQTRFAETSEDDGMLSRIARLLFDRVAYITSADTSISLSIYQLLGDKIEDLVEGHIVTCSRTNGQIELLDLSKTPMTTAMHTFRTALKALPKRKRKALCE
jgi:hypothetical protein